MTKTGPLYTLDCGTAVGSLDLMDETLDELERRFEEASQLRAKAVQYVTGLTTLTEGQGKAGEGQGGQGQTAVDVDHENETGLVQPLLECHSQMYQLRELIARRAASMVCS